MMGGRGSSSGISDKGRKYGTEYATLHESGNIKYVRYNNGSATAPMETMTKNRVYATIDYKNDVKHISYYDKDNKRYKQIDLDHYHKVDGVKEKPHTHRGYIHDELGTRVPNSSENKIIEKVLREWHNKKRK